MIADPPPLTPAETPTRRSSALAGFALIAVFVAIYVGSMFTPGLLDDADSAHAEAAREMVVTGDYVTLHINGVRYLEKAPLPYWLVAFSYRAFGVNEFSTRLPMVLSVLFLGLLGWVWARRAFGERAAIYVGLFAYTCAGVFLFTRVLIPDVLLSLLIAASCYFFLTALERKAPAWRWYAAYGMLALGLLTKGLIALVFPGGAIFLFLMVTGEWRRWREFRLFPGAALFLTIAAPWHILAALRNPGTPEHHGFLWFYFVNEHFLRFLGRRYPRDYNKLPAALYWSLHLVWLFPWSLYMPAAIRAGVQDWRDRDVKSRVQNDFAARTRLLCWILAGVVLLFFAFSTNQEYYTLPAYLPLLMMVADGVARCERAEGGPLRERGKARAGGLLISAGALAGIGLAASVVLIAGLWQSRHLPFEPDIGTVLSQQDMSAYSLSMAHMLDLSYASFAALRLPAALAAAVLLIAPSLSFHLRRLRRHYLATWTLAAGMAVFLIAAHIALARFGPYLSSKQLAQEISLRARPEDDVMIYGDQSFGSSLLFYLRRPIDLVEGRTTSMWFGSTFPDAPKIFLTDADLGREWASGRRIFLFVPPHQAAQVNTLLPRKFVVAQLSGKYIYSNQPSVGHLTIRAAASHTFLLRRIQHEDWTEHNTGCRDRCVGCRGIRTIRGHGAVFCNFGCSRHSSQDR